jgi:hypothetical protein
MDFGTTIFVLGIVAITTIAGVIRVSIMAKHGYPLHDRDSRRQMRRAMRGPFGMMRGWPVSGDESDPEAERKIALLSSENERLTGQIGRLEERLRVLERIATDPAERTAREIDALRNAD